MRRSLWLVVALAVGCRSAASAPAAAEEPEDYAAIEARVAAGRVALKKRLAAADDDAARAKVLADARGFFIDAVVDDIMPPWMGTPWGLGSNSTATRPHQQDMTVGCSYFVTSVLQSAGVKLDDRYKFAQAPALDIQKSLAPGKGAVHRYLSIPPAELAEHIAALGDGLYLIGLANHVGFVVVRGGKVRFVHASYTGQQVVSNEPLADAVAIAQSQDKGYFVSPLVVRAAGVNDWLVEKWLAGATVEFRR